MSCRDIVPAHAERTLLSPMAAGNSSRGQRNPVIISDSFDLRARVALAVGASALPS
jgi:hypothetical protein